MHRTFSQWLLSFSQKVKDFTSSTSSSPTASPDLAFSFKALRDLKFDLDPQILEVMFFWEQFPASLRHWWRGAGGGGRAALLGPHFLQRRAKGHQCW